MPPMLRDFVVLFCRPTRQAGCSTATAARRLHARSSSTRSTAGPPPSPRAAESPQDRSGPTEHSRKLSAWLPVRGADEALGGVVGVELGAVEEDRNHALVDVYVLALVERDAGEETAEL